MLVIPALFVALPMANCAAATSAARQANEISAIANLRIISSAQMAYSVACSKAGYATTLEDLAKPSKSDGTSFLPADPVKTGTARSGYKFTLARNSAKGVLDVGTAAETCNGSSNAPASSYFASAEPERPGVTGSRYFAVDDRVIIFTSTGPISNPIVESATVVRLQ